MIRTHNHPGGFTYINALELGDTEFIKLAKWIAMNSKQCPYIKGVEFPVYYTDWVEYQNSAPLDKTE